MQIQAINQFPIQPLRTDGTQNPGPTSELDLFSVLDRVDLSGGAIWAGLGAVPVLGAVTDFAAGIESGFNDSRVGSAAGGYGGLLNLGGSLSLGVALLTGSQTAKYLAIGMLGGAAIGGGLARAL
jgi:hypothetical protein